MSTSISVIAEALEILIDRGAELDDIELVLAGLRQQERRLRPEKNPIWKILSDGWVPPKITITSVEDLSDE